MGAAQAVSVAALALSLAGEAVAAGYALKEQSATAQGASFAGATAGGGNISYMFFNPAAITLHEGAQAHLSTSYIAPVSEPEVKGASSILGAPIAGGNGGGDVSVDALLPALYGSLQVTEQLFVGLGVNTPFGLGMDYDDGWAGRHHGVESELHTINANPVIAWKASEAFSLAAGLQVQYIEARLTSAVDVDFDGASDGSSELKGDDWGVGFTLGLLAQPWEGTHIGLSYRSQVNHRLDGDVEFSPLPAPLVDQGIAGDVTTPDTLSFGLRQRVDARWTLLADLTWTNWSHFDELRIEFDRAALPDNVTVEDWHDSWFAAVGAEYRASEALALRGGVAFDESPVPSDTRTPRLPGADRYWASFGASYAIADWLSLDAAATGIYVDDPDINLSATADPNNAARGNLRVDYDSWIGIVSLGGSIRF